MFALRVRFFQRNGHDAAAAVSSGAIASTANWAAKALLFLVSIGFAAGDFHVPSSSRSHQTAIWIVVGVVLAAGIAAEPRKIFYILGSVLAQLFVAMALGASLHAVGQRLFTAYLPPIWGWATLAWMRRREYV